MIRPVSFTLCGLVAAALVAGIAGVHTQAPAAQTPAVTIARLDPALDALIPKDATVDKLADGFAWVEGPVWDAKKGVLLFSDIPNNVVQQWKEGDGVTEFLRPSGYTGTTPFTGHEPGSNGLTFDAQHRLVLCQHGDRRISRMESPGRFIPLVERYEGKRLNSPNDLVYKSNGDLYFTDPAYGLPKTFDDPQRELPFTGVYRLRADGTLDLLTKELTAPNGVAFSPDEKTLYVTQSDPKNPLVMAYAVESDGTLGAGKVLLHPLDESKAGKPGMPDGIKVDASGNVFTTGPGGIWVISPEGTVLGRIETGVPTANLAWGNDGSTLYITANTALLRLKTTTKGKIL
jgi:gluconolactonase